MSTADALKKLTEALRAEYRAAVERTTAEERDLPEQARELTARVATLRAENERRAAAGVRVNLAPDSFDARHIALLKDNTRWHETKSKARGDLSNALTATLLRALQSLEVAQQVVHDLETRKAEREAEAAAVAAAAAEVKAKKDAEEREHHRFLVTGRR